MSLKWIGAILIVVTSASVGLNMSLAYLRQERQLAQLLQTFHYIKCELQYRLTPLPDQFEQCSKLVDGAVGHFYKTLYCELETQISPNVPCCFQAAIKKSTDLTPIAVSVLQRLGSTLGSFDLDGQLICLEDAENYCRVEIERIRAARPVRIRNYQTLSLCAGAALVILFI